MPFAAAAIVRSRMRPSAPAWWTELSGRWRRGGLSLILLGFCLSAWATPSPRIAFRIPAQPLDEALLSFSQQSGLPLAAVGDLDRARRSPGVSGVMTVEAALERLLEGSGYVFSVESGVITVSSRVVPRADRPASQPIALVAPTRTLAPLVVSARKRDERWVDVPMGLSVHDGERMEALGLQNVADALRLTPGVAAIDSGAAFTQVQIRGISSSLGGNDNGYYLDDIPFTGVTVPWHPDTRSFDLDRVEVLKGPQGTLFGEGSMGGTVRILTRAPELDRFSTAVQVGASRTEGGGDGGMGKAMANLPLVQDRLGLRLVATRETLAGWVDAPDGGRDMNPQRVTTRRARLRWSASDTWMTDVSHISSTTIADGGGYAATDALQSGVYQDTRSRWRANSISSSLELPASSLLLAMSDARLEYVMDGVISPTSTLRANLHINVESLELRWSSRGAGPMEWILGYSHREALRRDTLEVDGEPGASSQSNRADAVFGEATLARDGSPWSVTAGLRYFTDEVDGRALALTRDTRLRTTFQRLTPRLSLTRRFSDQRIAYAGVAGGFRSGQLQPADSLAAALAAGIPLPATLPPDSLISYEIGLKQITAGGRVLVQGAAFHTRWRDLPVRVPINGTYNGLINSRGAIVQGLELGLSYAPAAQLRLELGATWIDAYYAADVPGTPLRRGTQVYNVPRASLSGTATYAWPVGHDMNLTAASRASYHSRRQTGLVEGVEGDAIMDVGLRLGLESPNGWSGYLYGDNLLDEAGAVDGRTPYGNATRLRPRTYGMEFHYRF
ncbi:TonB-dependent receptor domain-containing protein [Pseudoxanthomonas beigongshangi]